MALIVTSRVRKTRVRWIWEVYEIDDTHIPKKILNRGDAKSEEYASFMANQWKNQIDQDRLK